MKSENRINAFFGKTALVKAEYMELAALINAKRVKIEGLVSGMRKYKNDKIMHSKLTELLKDKYEELKPLIEKLDVLYKQLVLLNDEAQQISKESDKPLKPVEKPGIIAASQACKTALNKAIKDKETPRPSDTATKRPSPIVDSLRDKASFEQKAQEAFLNSHKSKLIGNA